MSEESTQEPASAQEPAGLKEKAASLAKSLLPLLGAALRSFVLSFLLLSFLAFVMMIVALLVAYPGGMIAAILAAALALGIGLVAAWMASTKRAIAAALIQGVKTVGLGKHAARLVFDRLLRVAAEEAHGERGRAPAQMAERVPLKDAEARLRKAVEGLLAERAQKTGVRAWLARKVQAAVLEQVEALTLKRFRDEEAQHGGVDLVRVKGEVAEVVDRYLIDTLSGARLKATLLAVGLASIGSAGLAYGLRVLFLKMGWA